jgi:lysozyme
VLCGLALALSLPLLNNGRGPAPLAITTGKAPVTTVQTADRASANGQSRLTLTPRDGVGPYRITPERRALLNTIRFAEGTWTGGRHDGYRMLYGGRLIADLTRHPEILVRSRYNSAAAGAYQFLPRTWEEAARMLRLPDFGPASQDQAALYLVERRGVLQRFDRQGLCHEVLARLAPEWASLPTNSGQSYYGQPVQDARVLLRFYSAQLARERAAAPGPGQSA